MHEPASKMAMMVLLLLKQGATCIGRTVLDEFAFGVGTTCGTILNFFFGFVIGFTSVWQLTFVTLDVVPLMVIAGGTYVVLMAGLAKKGESAYAEAGKVAEEVAIASRFSWR